MSVLDFVLGKPLVHVVQDLLRSKWKQKRFVKIFKSYKSGPANCTIGILKRKVRAIKIEHFNVMP